MANYRIIKKNDYFYVQKEMKIFFFWPCWDYLARIKDDEPRYTEIFEYARKFCFEKDAKEAMKKCAELDEIRFNDRSEILETLTVK